MAPNVKCRVGYLFFVSPPSYAGGGLCFADVTFFFKCRPCHSTAGGQIVRRIVASTPSMKVTMAKNQATNFVARDGNKLAYPFLLFALARWHFTTDENIATPIIALTSTMIPRLSVNDEVVNMLVCPFIGSWIDYWNSLLFEMSDKNLNKLQRVRNRAARMLTVSAIACRMPSLQQLHHCVIHVGSYGKRN